MNVRCDGEGFLVLEGLHPFQVDTLRMVPELLEADPSLRHLRTFEGEDDEEQWQRLAVPELEHLFLGQAQIVRADLEQLSSSARGSLRIPEKHRPAWLAALNGASHSLYHAHDLRPDELRDGFEEIPDPTRRLVVIRVQLLGYLVALMLEAEGYGFPDSTT